MGSMLAGTLRRSRPRREARSRFARGPASVERQFVWFDRSGKEIGTVGAPDGGFVASPSMSPDGGSLAFLRRVNGNSDVWLLDTRRGVLSRFTDHAAEDIFPVWSRDGRRIVFTSNRNGAFDLYQKPTTGVGVEELLLPGAGQRRSPATGRQTASSCCIRGEASRRGGTSGRCRSLAGGEAVPGRPDEIRRAGRPVLSRRQVDRVPLQRSGRFEVYVQPFPGPGAAVAGVHEWWRSGALAARMAASCSTSRSTDGSWRLPSRSRPTVSRRRHTRSALRHARRPRPVDHRCAVRRVCRWAAVSDEHLRAGGPAPRRSGSS